MPIRFVTGKPGAGKGLVSMNTIIEELRTTKRPIITNFAIKMEPWVNARGEPQLGLRNHLLNKYGETFHAENRIFLLDEKQAGRFFLYRAFLVDAKELKYELKVASFRAREGKDGEEELIDFDPSLLSQSGGCLYVIDEAWMFWGARNWQKTGTALLFYNNQHRKVGDDTLIVTQHTKQIDAMIQRVAQEFWVCRNRSLLRVGIFRQPDDFSVAVFENPPTGAAQEPMNTFKFKLDAKGMASSFDTTAGVGLTGRLQGDVGRRKKGIPFKVLIALMVCVPLLVWYLVHHFLTWGAHKAVSTIELPQVQQPNALHGVTVPPAVPAKVHGFGMDFPVPPGFGNGVLASSQTNLPVKVTGKMFFAGNWVIALSDGRIYDSRDLSIHGVVTPQYVSLNGTNYEYANTADLKPLAAEMKLSTPEPVSSYQPRQVTAVHYQGGNLFPIGTTRVAAGALAQIPEAVVIPAGE